MKRFSKSHWISVENRKNFLEKIAKKFGIKSSSDWGKVTNLQISKNGGASLLHYCNGSIFNCLESTFTGMQLHSYIYF